MHRGSAEKYEDGITTCDESKARTKPSHGLIFWREGGEEGDRGQQRSGKET